MNSADRRTVGTASAIGLAGAAAGTFAGAYYRKLLPARTHTPDLPWALGEDAVAAGLAATAVRVWPEPRPWWRRVPRALARAPKAIARSPKTIARRPKAVTGTPTAIARTRKAIARTPKAVTRTRETVARAPGAVADAPRAAVQALARAPRAVVAGGVTPRRR